MNISGVLPSRKKLLAVAIACGGLWSSGLFAADAIEEVTVTGSRLRQTDGFTTPVPVTAVTLPELTTFDPGGTVSEQLNGLPQFFGNRSAQSSPGAMRANSGSSQLDMRNLGSNRTLVLLDGSRVVPADSTGVVGIDTFPTALMKNVEVVTGGASAAYGADALGGVVNFVLNREYEGFKAEVGTGVTEFGDGARWNASMAGGTKIGERLHVIGSVETLHIDQILRDPTQLDASWWQRWGWVTNPAWVSATATPNVPQRLTLPWVSSTESTPTGMIWARNGSASTSPLIPFALNGYTFTNDGQNVRAFIKGDVYAAPNLNGSTKSQSNSPESQIANRAFENGPYGAETHGRSGFTALKYDFTDNLSGFAQFLIGRSETGSPGRRSRYNLQGTSFATIFRDNAFLPKEVADAMDTAGITSFQLHKQGSFLGDNNIGLGDGKEIFTTISWSVGADIHLSNDWDARVSWQSGRSENNAGLFGQTRIDRVFLGMDAVRDPKTGAIVCRVQLFNPTEAQLAATPAIQGKTSVIGGPLRSPIGLDNSIRDCVPYNVMGAGNMSRAAVEYTMSPRTELSHVEQDFAEAVLNGDLFQGWSGPISFAAGLNWRQQSFKQWINSTVYEFGPPQNAPELGIRGIPPGYTGGSETLHQTSSLRDSSGDLDVWEAFGELGVPVYKSTTGPQSIDTSLAYRNSDYSRIGRVQSWKIGVNIQAFEDLRLRFTRSRDVREPTFTELYNNRGGQGGNPEDPLTGNSYLVTVRAGGNPNLNPEVGNTMVAGFVYQPSWFEGLQVSSDYYDVQIKDAVSSLGVQRIVDGCYIQKDESLCNAITRDPTTGLITMIANGYLNVAQARVRGVDTEVVYRTKPNFFGTGDESFNLRGLAGSLIERSDTPLDGLPLNVAGALGNPKLTANLTANYRIGSYGIQLQQRYIASTKLNINWVEGRDVDKLWLTSGNYTNLRLSKEGELQKGGSWTVALNVNNLFDRPPAIQPGSTGQSIPGGYDQFGRRYQLSMNLSF
ncbi:MAG: TonB-dependent receptor [Pseudomonadales bacterium]|jgi:outer membrane receptor protein involved in Fe transport|nr:TonB-dependent receptor [Pseudomonadales bacterium]